MLHVTNGDSAAEALGQCGLEGTVVTWKDVLHDGPVPEDLAPEALRAVRAAFIASQGWASFGDVLGDLRRRDAAVAQAERGVLWFECDAFDQLQLLQAVDALARAQRTGGWALVQHDGDALAELDTATLRQRHEGAADLTEAHVALARRAWAAWRAPTPERWVALLGEDTSALPYLAPALERLAEELPAAHDGLGRSERQLLQLLAAEGPLPWTQLFARWVEQEEVRWMGDWSLLRRLQALSTADAQLVQQHGPLWALTSVGDDVLEGRADWAALRGPQRWLGGTLLDARGGAGVWRWDADARALVGPL